MSETNSNGNGQGNIIGLKDMYEDYFLDYASYVILERAVPSIYDGLKPVQRRILHALKEMDDGRYHKVANAIGQTMQYHPHGDAAIGEAMINLGQKDLLIDCQGNWGDIRTGDSAAAPRYIEARLTKFALEVAFNSQTTEWQLAYDGRKKEPIDLPMKFPLLLAQGVEGIAVGLSTRILPHNFIELIKGAIKILQGKPVKLFPDFQTGGLVDVSDYNDGKRGGRVKVRARIEQADKNTLLIKELPYGVTTSSLIDSIIKANDKGKIKIKRVSDNTAQEVEIAIELAQGVSPDLTMDALYAFTQCEVSISPNACVIVDEKPHFLSVTDILQASSEHTKHLLLQELEIKLAELQEKWHFTSLEKIFIENRIYRDIEECESWEEVIETIDAGLKKYVATPGDPLKGDKDQRLLLMRDVTKDDIVRLTEIRIKRISKYNTFAAEEKIAQLESDIRQTRYDIQHLNDFTIAYYQRLLEKYGKGRERRTEITAFDTIQASEVVANNAKLYVNRKDGFIGMGLKKDELVCECSDIDDIIAFRKDGQFVVTRIGEKVFVGKDIIHVDVWKKGDDRTTYNAIYVDGKTGRSFAKRFQVKAITRDREYPVTKGNPNSRILYFSTNPNGEAEVVTIQLSQSSSARKKIFDFDFSELSIKGRTSQGNTLTKYPVRKVQLKETGKSTLGALTVWIDEASGRLNTDERGRKLGDFDTGDHLLAIYKDGQYEVAELDLTRKFDSQETVFIGKFDPEAPINVIYYEGGKRWTMGKRFLVETTSLDQRYLFISDHKDSKLLYARPGKIPLLRYSFQVKGKKTESEVQLEEFIDIKGWKALGNRLSKYKVTKVQEDDTAPAPEGGDKLQVGDQVDFEGNGQTKLFE